MGLVLGLVLARAGQALAQVVEPALVLDLGQGPDSVPAAEEQGLEQEEAGQARRPYKSRWQTPRTRTCRWTWTCAAR